MRKCTGVFVHHILEDEVDGQKEEQDQREDEEGGNESEMSRQSEKHTTMPMRHETWMGMSECGPKLEQCACTCITVNWA